MDYNTNGQSGEQVLQELETRAVATATRMWFEKDPYVAKLYAVMPPDDRNALIEKVRVDATETGFMALDAEKWLSHHVNKMFDEGKLPEIAKAQQAVIIQEQAVEDYGIQNAPMKEVNAVLEQRYGRKQGPNILPQTPATSEVMTLDQAIADDEARQAQPRKGFDHAPAFLRSGWK
jgi:hypothetical protein